MSRISALDLTGCFATDGTIHPGLGTGGAAHPRRWHLPETVFTGTAVALEAISRAGSQDATCALAPNPFSSPAAPAPSAGAASMPSPREPGHTRDPAPRTGPSRREEDTGLEPHPVAEAMKETARIRPVTTSRLVVGLPDLGEVIDKYRIEEELGIGGFAVVYRATHLLMRTTVALKVLHPKLLEKRPQLAEQMCEEARFTSLINHPNVVRVFDVTSGGKYTYIVMEHIDGPSLRTAVAKGPLSSLNVTKVGIQVCAGLKAGYEQGLVHRDVKPGNVLISRNGRAKLVDFGLARTVVLGEGGGRISTTDREIAGTPAYMAPEQATHPTRIDYRADLYALGATLFHAATGLPPFNEQDPVSLVYAHIHREPPDPRTLVPAIPACLADLLLDLLAKDPARRPAAHDILDERLRRCLELERARQPVATTRRMSADTHQTPPSAQGRELIRRVRNLFGR